MIQIESHIFVTYMHNHQVDGGWSYEIRKVSEDGFIFLSLTPSGRVEPKNQEGGPLGVKAKKDGGKI